MYILCTDYPPAGEGHRCARGPDRGRRHGGHEAQIYVIMYKHVYLYNYVYLYLTMISFSLSLYIYIHR